MLGGILGGLIGSIAVCGGIIGGGDCGGGPKPPPDEPVPISGGSLIGTSPVVAIPPEQLWHSAASSAAPPK